VRECGAQHFICAGSGLRPDGCEKKAGFSLREEFLKSLRRGEGTSYIAPAVAGSNPASDESRCSSKWQSNGYKTLGPPIPAANIFRCGEGASFIGRALRFPERGGFKSHTSLATLAKLEPLVPTGTKCRDGAVQSYFVCHTMWS
jgi:hypothetical protein